MRAKWIVVSLALWLGLSLTGPGHGAEPGAKPRDAIEQEVLTLDVKEADAVLRGDIAALDELWAEDFIVNNPSNKITLGRQGPVGTGAMTYEKFERVAETVARRGDVAIVMGRETVVPKAPSPNAGRTLQRRYTNVWLKTARGWKLAARHANVIAGATQNAP